MNKIAKLLIVLLITTGSCNKKTTNSTASKQVNDNCEWNTTNKYSLCVFEVKDEKSNRPPFKKFMIVDKDDNILKEGVIDNGTARWLSEDIVEIIQTPGTISNDANENDFSNYFIVSESKLVTKKEFLQSKAGKIQVDSIPNLKIDLNPDACIIEARIISKKNDIVTIEILDVKVCRTVAKEPKRGDVYKIELNNKTLLVEKNYTLEVSIPTESRDDKLFLLKVLK